MWTAVFNNYMHHANDMIIFFWFFFIITVSLFKLFEPLIGAKSIQYANKEDGKNRRKQYNTVFNQNYLHHYYAKIQEVKKLVSFLSYYVE